MSKLLEANMMEKKPLVIVGAGMASPRLMGQLVARAPGCYAVPLNAEEQRPPYKRVLAGEIAVLQIDLRPTARWPAAGVKMIAHASIAATRGSLKFDAPLLLEAA
jgi:hypothetical protein